MGGRGVAATHAGTGQRPGLNMTASAADAFIAEHAERAGKLADAVGLRPDSVARSAGPLGVQALGRVARLALATGEPTQAAQAAERAAALAGGLLPARDRLVHARRAVQTGRIAEALSYAEKITANAGDDAAVRAGALLVAGRAHRLGGDLQRGYELWLEALDAATVAGLPDERGEAMRRLGHGRLHRRADGPRRAPVLRVVPGRGRDRRPARPGLVVAGSGLGHHHPRRLRRRRRGARPGRPPLRRDRDPVGRAWLRGTTAFVRLLAGRLGEARRLARAFLPFGERLGEAWAVGTLRAVEAMAAAESGELAEADRAARRAYRDFAAAGDDWGRGLSLVVRGVVARGLAEPAHAIDLLSHADAYGQKSGHPLLIGMARTIRGFASIEQGDGVAAEADAQTVLDLVEARDVLESARVGPRVLFALARRAQGDLDTALSVLSTVAEAPAGPAAAVRAAARHRRLRVGAALGRTGRTRRSSGRAAPRRRRGRTCAAGSTPPARSRRLSPRPARPRRPG